MKSKKRHQSSEDDSESDASDRSSSSESESEDSSASEHRHRKKKRADSSDSDSDSDDHRRKKRKHKKKKKKHGKRKRRSDSIADSRSDGDAYSSVSEGEVSPKKKRKKHKQKRSRSSSGSVIEIIDRKERRLHSVVKERRRSSEEEERPARTYYQKEYHSESPADELENQRQQEVQRFYRGSSKERRYHEQYQYEEREHQRFEPYQQEQDYSTKNTLEQSSVFSVPNDVTQRGQRGGQGQRNPRYEGHHRPPHGEEYQRRPREDNYHPREQQRGFNNRYNQFEERGPKRNFADGRDNRDRERRGPPEGERFREREYPERRERYNREEPFQPERARDARRDKPPPPRGDRPPPPHQRGEGRTGSVEARSRERGRRPEPRVEREPESRAEREPERRAEREPERRAEREPERQPERRDERERRPRGPPHAREKHSRFADAEGDKEYTWGKTEVKKEAADGDREKPNFGLSGKLTADANTVNGVVIKYTEPDDAKQPKRRWRFYPFKGDKALPILYIHRQSAFLIGRDKKVCDITLEHPSISKQHAALQYRAAPFTRPDGSQARRVRPYVIDLESANGTFVNNKKIEARRYVELLEKDVVKFGFSQREYVLLHENSKDEAQDDDDTPAVPVATVDQLKREKRAQLETAEDGE